MTYAYLNSKNSHSLGLLLVLDEGTGAERQSLAQVMKLMSSGINPVLPEPVFSCFTGPESNVNAQTEQKAALEDLLIRAKSTNVSFYLRSHGHSCFQDLTACKIVKHPMWGKLLLF